MAENSRSGRRRRSESSTHNSIACETCRTKKRRCDRSLPVCLQCAHDPSQCHYPEQNKRGLPSGYVTRLEARLAETEAAMYQLLDQRHGNEMPMLSEIPSLPAPASTNKTERVKEWDRLSLHSINDVQRWYQSKAMEGGHSSRASPPMTTVSSTSHGAGVHGTDTLWGTETRQMAPTSRTRQSQPPRAWVTPATPTTAAPEGVSGTPESNSSKAKELSRTQNNMYF